MTRMAVVGKPEWVADWYRHERALTFRLADQVSALTALLNRAPAPPGYVLRDLASREIAGQPPPTCRWRDDEGIWEGTCGITWEIPNDAGPAGNQMNFCPQCGQILEVQPHQEDEQDE